MNLTVKLLHAEISQERPVLPLRERGIQMLSRHRYVSAAVSPEREPVRIHRTVCFMVCTSMYHHSSLSERNCRVCRTVPEDKGARVF